MSAIPNSTVKNVLDHGFVRLVSFMQPLDHSVPFTPSDEVGKWSGDLEVVRNARTSYDADWRTGEDEGKDENLIRYLLKNGHTSPFEAMVFTFEVKAPLFVFRQWHRHRTWSYNEVSARYAELPAEFYVPEMEEITTQHTSNKQMRTDTQNPYALLIQSYMKKNGLDAFSLYKELLAAGCPRELARTVLPVGTYSRMFATVDLHNLFHFLRLRMHEHAQKEIRVYAEAMLGLIEPICPISVRVFRELHQ